MIVGLIHGALARDYLYSLFLNVRKFGKNITLVAMTRKRKQNHSLDPRNQHQRPRRVIHPKNRYAETPPNFEELSSLYPSFAQYVFYSAPSDRPQIDWTDYNATRELTRVLLLHDFGIRWWIPDGQLCPAVPNRANYIHWIEDLLCSQLVPKLEEDADGSVVKGFDIGTGANCIYPLLGASLNGWHFVGSDATDVALEWSRKNVDSNPSLKELIEIRFAGKGKDTKEEYQDVKNTEGVQSELSSTGRTDHFHTLSSKVSLEESKNTLEHAASSSNVGNLKTVNHLDDVFNEHFGEYFREYSGPPVLLGVVKENETFDFCMCNPPFFESIMEAGKNPRSSFGGTMEEMVCSGGELSFIKRIIDDSVHLKQHIRWYTTMVGRKVNIKILSKYLYKVGAKIVQTTEFVQGRTSRWGLAWSFLSSPKRILVTPHAQPKANLSFTLEGIQRHCSALNALQSVERFFLNVGASCKVDTSSFTVSVTFSSSPEDIKQSIGASETNNFEGCQPDNYRDINNNQSMPNELSLRILIFEQSPGTLLVKGSSKQKDASSSEAFSLLFCQLEESLRRNLGLKLNSD